MNEASRLSRALDAIDAANADDPNTLSIDGERRPKELTHAALVSEWVLRLRPAASEPLRLAARAHHVRRWEIARSEYPEGPAGYHRWRKVLQAHHAQVLSTVLRSLDYDAPTVERACALVQKQGLGRDPEVQTLEDALCLVFLETQFRELADRLDEAKLLEVTRKTLAKMSPQAIEQAHGLALDPDSRTMLERAANFRRGRT